jgi:hypothetical protein
MPASDAAMRPPRRALRRCVLLLVYLAASLLFTELHMAWSYGHPAATPEQLMRFEAARPYQYRVLVPALAHLVHGATGLDASASYRLIGVLAGFFLLVAFRGYLSRFVPPAAAASGALAILYPLLWNVSPASPLRFFYPSDVPAVLFTVLGLAALAAERMKLFYLVFAVATLNRETSCFLGFAYLFAGLGRRDLATLSRHLGLQLTIWLAIKLALDTVFAGSPGSLVDLMAPRNAALWSSLLRLEPEPGALALLWPCGAIWLLIPLAWRAQPPFLRRVLAVAIPFYAGMATVGNLDELRIFGELAPVLTAPAVFAVWHRLARARRHGADGGR